MTAIQEGRMAHSTIASYFKEVFISEQLQTQKPDPDFFEKVGQRIPGFRKEQTLMIGDSLSADIAGGNAAGIDTVWYNPEHLENASQVMPTYEVDSYSKILALLK